MREKLKNYLNIANKAGYLIIGGEKLSNYTKKLYLILIDKDAGKSTKKIFENITGKGVQGAEIENLEKLVCVDKCKLVAIKKFGLSEQIKKYINRGE